MIKKHFVSIILGVLISATAQSATVYVSDTQFVAIREGFDNSTRAVERGLKSGTPLEVLEQSEGYTKVRTPIGNEGWVADYFLSDDAVTRDQVESLNNQLTRMKKNRANDLTQLKELKEEIKNRDQTISTIKNENNTLKKQLQKADSLTIEAKSILSKNDDFTYQLQTLEQQTRAAQEKAEQLQNSTQQKWFALGAATLFGGLLLGGVLPLIRGRRRTGSWS